MADEAKPRKKPAKRKKAKSIKLRLWLHHFLNSSNRATFLNKTASAQAAKYKAKSYESFANIGYQNYKKLEEEILEWIESEGLSQTALKCKLIEGLECTETVFKGHEIKGVAYISHKGMAYRLEEALLSEDQELNAIARQILASNGDGIVDTGYLIEERTVIPWDTRRKYLELAMNVQKMIGPKNVKLEVTGKDGNPIEFTDTQRAARLASLLNLAQRRKAEQEDQLNEQTAPEE